MRLVLLSGIILASTIHAQAPATGASVTQIVNQISKRAAAAKEYAFEGNLELIAQRGAAVGSTVSQAKVHLASAPDGRYFLRIEAVEKPEYLLISNGQKSWAYVPKLKQYTEEETAALEDADSDSDEDAGASSDERDPAETFVRQVLPVLSKLYKTAEAADFNGEATVNYQNKKQKWPMVRVMSRTDQQGGRSQTDLAVDPVTMNIGRLVWTNLSYDGQEKVVMRLTLDFHSFQMGEPLPDSTFEFVPPKNAKLADVVPIPGQTGSVLLNRPAPDVELKTLEGEKIRLSALRGHPVLLTFWASWCGPCRREMPAMVKLHEAYKDKGLVVLGVNDEGKGTARKFVETAGLTFQVLDDSGRKAASLFQVRAIPAVYLIDGDGKVVRFLRGAHEYAALCSALQAVGL